MKSNEDRPTLVALDDATGFAYDNPTKPVNLAEPFNWDAPIDIDPQNPPNEMWASVRCC
jgi:hypothetical protein